jgi:hypothetical protein
MASTNSLSPSRVHRGTWTSTGTRTLARADKARAKLVEDPGCAKTTSNMFGSRRRNVVPYFVDGNEKIAPSRTPADGLIVFRFV